MCGLTAELNLVSDLDLQLSAQQLRLLATLADQVIALSTKAVQQSRSEKVKAGPVAASHDSGVASEMSTTTHPDPLPVRTEDKEGVHAPANVLLTAGRISLTLYNHLKLQSDTVVGPAYSSSTSHTTPAHQSSRQQSTGTSYSADNFVSLTQGMPNLSQRAVTKEEYMSFSLTQPQTDEDACVELAVGSVCVQPFVYIYVAQPHTVLSTWPSADRLELSCYDILVKGGRPNYMFPGMPKIHTTPKVRLLLLLLTQTVALSLSQKDTLCD